MVNKVGRRYLKLETWCFKNTVAVAFLRTSFKFDLYWYLFTLESKEEMWSQRLYHLFSDKQKQKSIP